MIKQRFVLIAILLFGIALTYSCKKETEEVVECLTEELLFTFDYTVDAQDSKTVTFTITYAGEHTLDNSIKWDFGDGTVKTLNGTTAQHTYNAAGSYHVKPEVTIRNGDAYCTYEFEKTVEIN